MCKENPTLLNGMELRGRSVLFDRDQFAIGYRTFVYRDARYAAARTDPRPFGPASTANRLATASDVALARQVLEHSAQACRNPACCTLAQDNAALRRRLRRLTARLRARLLIHHAVFCVFVLCTFSPSVCCGKLARSGPRDGPEAAVRRRRGIERAQRRRRRQQQQQQRGL